jgi:hypothetical protein
LILAIAFAPAVRCQDSSRSVTVGSGPALEMRQAPVPLIRKGPVPVQPSAPDVETTLGQVRPSAAEALARNGLSSQGAKAAVEADGYKRATVLGREPNGIWRAKGYRGMTEVLLTVDRTGKVSMD